MPSPARSNGTHGIRNLHFGPVTADVIYHADRQTLEVKTNEPFTLVVNQMRYKIPAPGKVISYKP
jgi:hypothetical protein